MLGELSGVAKFFLVTGYTDMRKSIDGLMAIIRDTYELDPYSNSLFLFCGRRCDRIKALHFEKDGFCLYYKRLDNGAVSMAQGFFRSKKPYPSGIPMVTGRAVY